MDMVDGIAVSRSSDVAYGDQRQRLQGKIVLITSATSEQGKVIVMACHKAGAKVVAVDSGAMTLQLRKLREEIAAIVGLNVKDHLEQLSKRYIEIFPADVTKQDDVRRLVRTHNQVDVLVNGTRGDFHRSPVTSLSETGWDQCIEQNMTPVFLTCKYYTQLWTCTGDFLPEGDLLPEGRKPRAGSIINFSSVTSSIRAANEHFVYAACMGGIIAMSKSIAKDFAANSIRCNVICPADESTGSCCTTPNDVASMVVYLASDESTFATASTIVLDGGYSN